MPSASSLALSRVASPNRTHVLSCVVARGEGGGSGVGGGGGRWM